MSVTTIGLDDAPIDELVSTASSEPIIDYLSEAKLVELLTAGHSDALDRLVRSNLRIAVDEAIRNRGLGERQEWLVRRAAHALMESAGSYDPLQHGRFSHYARRAVRRAIRTVQPS
jgi:DNA-directed RNA polymerase specialized sigma subunit